MRISLTQPVSDADREAARQDEEDKRARQHAALDAMHELEDELERNGCGRSIDCAWGCPGCPRPGPEGQRGSGDA